MSGAWPYVVIVGELAAKLTLTAVIIVRSRSTPAVRLAWLVVILAVPGVGIAAYLLVGEVRLGRRRRRRYASIVKRIGKQAAIMAASHMPRPARQRIWMGSSRRPDRGRRCRHRRDSDRDVSDLTGKSALASPASLR